MSDEFEDIDTELDQETQEWVDLCNRILDDCDDVPESAEDFALSVSERIGDMRDWIIANRRTTSDMRLAIERMETALNNAKDGE